MADLEQIVAEMQEKMEKCEAGVWSELKSLKDYVEKQSIVRSEMNDKLDGIKKDFKSHTEDEMDKQQEFIDALNHLTKTMETLIQETSSNSEYVNKVKHDEAVASEVAEQVEAINAPKKLIKDRIMITVVTVVTGTLVSGILAAGWFGFKMYALVIGTE